MSGALNGVKVLELDAIGPVPFCGMLLADLGADVLTIERPVKGQPSRRDTELLRRGKRSVVLDLKSPEGKDAVLALIAQADALIEGMRPGVMERLGLGPDIALLRNPRLVYGRMTGWGQDGPLAMSAGHDLNFIGLTGLLDAIGRRGESPVPPLNVVGDYGGGGMYLAFGVVAALLEAQRSRQGQVVDAAMVDGASLLATYFHGLLARGAWQPERGSNVLDGGAPWYDVYETSDARHVAVAAIEQPFYAELLRKLGLDEATVPDRNDRSAWPLLRSRFAEIFGTRKRDAWAAHFRDSDACVTPVLSFAEAPAHPHHQARRSFSTVSGVVQPAAGPRMSRTPAQTRRPPPARGEQAQQALIDWGLTRSEVDRVMSAGERRHPGW